MTTQIVRKWVLSVGPCGDVPDDLYPCTDDFKEDLLAYAIRLVRDELANDFVIPASWAASWETPNSILVERYSRA